MSRCTKCGLIGHVICETCPEYNTQKYMATLRAKGRLQGKIPGTSNVSGTLTEKSEKIIGKLKGHAYRTDTYLKMKKDPLFNLYMKIKTQIRRFKRWLSSD